MAAQLKLPIQCHTGMGQLTGTNAMAMKEVIESNPETKFVIFHCSYPWMDDVNALLRTYKNVYPDLCWLSMLSTSAAIRMFRELIEVELQIRYAGDVIHGHLRKAMVLY